MSNTNTKLSLQAYLTAHNAHLTAQHRKARRFFVIRPFKTTTGLVLFRVIDNDACENLSFVTDGPVSDETFSLIASEVTELISLIYKDDHDAFLSTLEGILSTHKFGMASIQRPYLPPNGENASTIG